MIKIEETNTRPYTSIIYLQQYDIQFLSTFLAKERYEDAFGKKIATILNREDVLKEEQVAKIEIGFDQKEYLFLDFIKMLCIRGVLLERDALLTMEKEELKKHLESSKQHPAFFKQIFNGMQIDISKVEYEIKTYELAIDLQEKMNTLMQYTSTFAPIVVEPYIQISKELEVSGISGEDVKRLQLLKVEKSEENRYDIKNDGHTSTKELIE